MSQPELSVQRSSVAERKKRWGRKMVEAALAVGPDPESGRPRLTGREMHVLWFLESAVGYGNVLEVSHGAVARELGLRRPHVSAAIKELADRDFLAPEEALPGRARRYIWNPARYYVGEDAHWDATAARFRRARAAFKLAQRPKAPPPK